MLVKSRALWWELTFQESPDMTTSLSPLRSARRLARENSLRFIRSKLDLHSRAYLGRVQLRFVIKVSASPILRLPREGEGSSSFNLLALSNNFFKSVSVGL